MANLVMANLVVANLVVANLVVAIGAGGLKLGVRRPASG